MGLLSRTAISASRNTQWSFVTFHQSGQFSRPEKSWKGTKNISKRSEASVIKYLSTFFFFIEFAIIETPKHITFSWWLPKGYRWWTLPNGLRKSTSFIPLFEAAIKITNSLGFTKDCSSVGLCGQCCKNIRWNRGRYKFYFRHTRRELEAFSKNVRTIFFILWTKLYLTLHA